MYRLLAVIVIVIVVMRILKISEVIVSIWRTNPLIERRPDTPQSCSCSISIFFRICAWIVVEVVVQMGVRSSNRNDSILAGKSTVVDIRRSPEISTGW